ncbi:MAG: P-loop NTPase [Sandaracinaceae bacterium]|nr:P-loop NTPase [Sandaracinaceae bacterium]
MRLALELGQGARLDADALTSDLSRALGSWFVPPVLGDRSTPDFRRVRSLVFEQHTPWADASYRNLAGERTRPPDGRWHRLERRLSKLDWVAPRKAQLPWKLRRTMPAVVTFYSFKGGVGRTTLVASTALQLAREAKNVVVVDLDVEAPGVSSLLGAVSERGLLDFLVDHAAVNATSLDGLLAPATALGDEASRVSVIGAGRLDADYFEKLARLDFIGAQLGGDDASPVTQALRQLLLALANRAPRPDYILLDSRAGLHDVAGLSLHDLAHVDVLVGRDSDQGYRGLELTAMALGRRRTLDDLRCAVVQTMAPDDPTAEEYKRITAEYRKRSYDAFVEHVYADDDDLPEIDDDVSAHYPTVVRFQPRLVSFTTLTVRREELLGADFVAVKDRIAALCQPEDP